MNARDAISSVGTITVASGRRHVAADDTTVPQGTSAGDYVWFSVTDDGCGMNTETRARVFEPFFTTKGIGKGTGLGLATVYGIVEQNHGFIDLQSEVGKGTVFAIHLPRHAGRAEAAWATPALTRPRVFLQKPFTTQELLTLVHQGLGHSTA